jgi:hypothetical protein
MNEMTRNQCRRLCLLNPSITPKSSESTSELLPTPSSRSSCPGSKMRAAYWTAASSLPRRVCAGPRIQSGAATQAERGSRAQLGPLMPRYNIGRGGEEGGGGEGGVALPVVRRAHIALRKPVAGAGARPWRHSAGRRKWLRGPNGRRRAPSWLRSSPAEACSNRNRAPCSPPRSSLRGRPAADDSTHIKLRGV